MEAHCQLMPSALHTKVKKNILINSSWTMGDPKGDNNFRVF